MMRLTCLVINGPLQQKDSASRVPPCGSLCARHSNAPRRPTCASRRRIKPFSLDNNTFSKRRVVCSTQVLWHSPFHVQIPTFSKALCCGSIDRSSQIFLGAALPYRALRSRLTPEKDTQASCRLKTTPFTMFMFNPSFSQNNQTETRKSYPVESPLLK